MSHKVFKKQSGFTLLELLIVIVIIGILALLILPNITSAPKKAHDTKRKTDVGQIKKALEDYYVSNQAYPVGSGDPVTALNVLTLGTAPTLKPIPVDPKNTSPYVYNYASTDGQTYTLTACLENGGDNGPSTQNAVAPCTTRTFQLTNSAN